VEAELSGSEREEEDDAQDFDAACRGHLARPPEEGGGLRGCNAWLDGERTQDLGTYGICGILSSGMRWSSWRKGGKLCVAGLRHTMATPQ